MMTILVDRQRGVYPFAPDAFGRDPSGIQLGVESQDMSDSPIGERQFARRRRPSLVEEACQHIRSSIGEGKHWAGVQLPTEAEYVETLGVSRTVIREAIARLAAEGLVEARQGKGVFVSETARYQAFQVTREELDNISDVIQLLELRLGIETEMASLAAERRDEFDLRDMRRHLKVLSQAAVDRDTSVNADVAFHQAIARASRNLYYGKLIDFLGVRLVPPRSVYLRQNQDYMGEEYRSVIGLEHEALIDAIAARDPERAHAAARAHMSESLKRHREIQQAIGR